jgi:hypothetical protein
VAGTIIKQKGPGIAPGPFFVPERSQPFHVHFQKLAARERSNRESKCSDYFFLLFETPIKTVTNEMATASSDIQTAVLMCYSSC